MSHYPGRCEDCVPCGDCGTTAYCLSEPNPLPPCPHDRALCGECNLAGCPDCRREAFADMCETGDYSAAADPFYRPTGDEATTLAEVLARQRADLERRKAETGFDPRTNSRRRA